MQLHTKILIVNYIKNMSMMILVTTDIYIYIVKVKLATVVKGDQKAPFSIATTPRSRGGHHSFSWIASLYPWSVPYNAEC